MPPFSSVLAPSFYSLVSLIEPDNLDDTPLSSLDAVSSSQLPSHLFFLFVANPASSQNPLADADSCASYTMITRL